MPQNYLALKNYLAVTFTLIHHLHLTYKMNIFLYFYARSETFCDFRAYVST
jgi:hypothetical protein